MPLPMGLLRSANDKTAITSVIKSDDPKEVSGLEKDSEPGLDAACDDMMTAFHAKDSQQLKDALKSFIVMFNDSQESDEPSAPEAEMSEG